MSEALPEPRKHSRIVLMASPEPTVAALPDEAPAGRGAARRRDGRRGAANGAADARNLQRRAHQRPAQGLPPLAAKSLGWRPRDVPAAACDGSAVAAHACVGVQYSRIVYWDGCEELVSYSCIVCADGANYSV